MPEKDLIISQSPFGFDDLLVHKHRLRYEILIKFFNDYNKQVTFYKFGEMKPEGICGVVEIIHDLINNKKGSNRIQFGKLRISRMILLLAGFSKVSHLN